MIKNSQDDNSGVLESSRSPAEALRQQLIDVLVGSTEGVALDMQQLNRKRKQYDANRIMELVTAYAATVEREGRINEIKRLDAVFPDLWKENRDYTLKDLQKLVTYISERDDELAALQGPQE